MHFCLVGGEDFGLLLFSLDNGGVYVVNVLQVAVSSFHKNVWIIEKL